MAFVDLSIGGRNYQLGCEDGEEQRLLELGNYVDSKVRGLLSEMGHIGESRLLVMTCLLIADELGEAKKKNISGDTAEETSDSDDNYKLSLELEQVIAEKINNLSEKIYSIAQSIEKP